MADVEIIDAFPGLMDEEGSGVIIPTLPPLDTLAATSGDVSGWLTEGDLAKLGADVVADYRKDLSDRADWQDTVEQALEIAAQEKKGAEKIYPWPQCSNINFPLLTTAALQFNARAYPAIVKGDEAVSVKIVGKDRGQPQIGPDGMPMAQGPDGRLIPGSLAAMAPPEVAQMLQPAWAVPPGGKAERAQRVADYLNTVLFYRMKDWEADTDSLLMQLPIVGCVFRKVWFDIETGTQRAAMIPALRVVVPEGARSCETAPRLTEEIPDVFPYEIDARIRSGFYRQVVINPDEEDRAGARMLLEQRRLVDMDGDGMAEPYVVTVDLESEQVLRIEPDYGPQSVRTDTEGNAVAIERGRYYVKYDFFPHPQGKFYGIGLGHLLKQVGAVVDTALNQLIDAGAAQTAGGGFIAAGIRLQGRHSVLRFRPGEYKTVETSGAALREGIVERTLPNVSPVTFQVLDLIMGAARDISGVKDVITGEASNNGQVGTTLALIEQGLQVFNAVYKRVYRALKDEFTLIYRNVSLYGGEEAARDYALVMDDPNANFQADFSPEDMDIRPVSDPTSVTRMQKMARAQALLQTAALPGANPVAILKRVYEAMDVENPDELMAPPPQPDPKTVADVEATKAKALKDAADAGKKQAETEQIGLEMELSEAKAAYEAFAQGFSLVT